MPLLHSLYVGLAGLELYAAQASLLEIVLPNLQMLGLQTYTTTPPLRNLQALWAILSPTQG